jgi:hypothetical protein
MIVGCYNSKSCKSCSSCQIRSRVSHPAARLATVCGFLNWADYLLGVGEKPLFLGGWSGKVFTTSARRLVQFSGCVQARRRLRRQR